MELFPELQKFLSQEEKSEKINIQSVWMTRELGPRTKLGSSDVRTQEELRHLAVCHYPTAMTDTDSRALLK